MSHQQWINQLTEDEQISIVLSYPTAIRQIINPSTNVAIAAIERDTDSITNEVSLTPEAQHYYISKYPHFFDNIKNPTYDVQNIALERNPLNIMYIEDPTDDQLMKVISLDPNILYFLKSKFNIKPEIENYAKIVM